MTKIGIVGVGAVGTAVAKSLILLRTRSEIVLLDIDRGRATGVTADLSHLSTLCPPTRLHTGGYQDLGDAEIVVVTAGVNEKGGNAIDRNDSRGRLLLLPPNASIYASVIPRIAAVAPQAVILVVTDPPDALADVARRFTSTNPVLSAGTFLDSQRFKLQIGQRLGCHATAVDAQVIGEHGTSQVYVWSSASIGGEGVLDFASRLGGDPRQFRTEVEAAVKFANIEIIEGTGASQHGIGLVAAQIVEAILADTNLVEPVGVLHPRFGVTLSLPCIIGVGGAKAVLRPSLSPDEESAFAKSAGILRTALEALSWPPPTA